MKNNNANLETLLFAKLAATERSVFNFEKELEHETEFLKSIGFYVAAHKTENLAAALQTFLAVYRDAFYDGMAAAL